MMRVTAEETSRATRRCVSRSDDARARILLIFFFVWEFRGGGVFGWETNGTGWGS